MPMFRKPLPKPRRPYQRLWVLILSGFALLCLSGCVRYDVGVTVTGQYGGEITQHIRLGEPLTNFSQREVQTWLDTLEQRAHKLHGRTQRLAAAELMVTIPFSNGAQLQERFNQFFNPTDAAASVRPPREANPLIELAAGLKLQQRNFLLWERDRLNLDVDLRELGSLGRDRELVLDANSVLNLTFSLNTPWGAKVAASGAVPAHQGATGVTWQLEPGTINHLSAVFWLPSPLGFGAIAILALSLAGAYLKTRLNPTTV